MWLVWCVEWFVELMGFPFSTIFDWGISDAVRSIFLLWQVRIGPGTSWTTYLTYWWIVVVVVFIAIVDAIYVATFSSSGNLFPTRVLRLLVANFVTILFIPILNVLVPIFNCRRVVDDLGNIEWELQTIVGNDGESITCFTGQHIAFAVVTSILLVLFTILTFSSILVFHEPNPLVGSLTARLHSRNEVKFLITKSVLTAIFTLQPSRPLVLVALMLSAVVFTSTAIQYLPFYSLWFNSVSVAVNATFSWAACCALLVNFFPGMSSIFTAWFLLIPVVMVAASRLAKRRYAKLCRYPPPPPPTDKADLLTFDCGPAWYLDFSSPADVEIAARFVYTRGIRVEDLGLPIHQRCLAHAHIVYQKGLRYFPRSQLVRMAYINFLQRYAADDDKTVLVAESLNLKRDNPTFESRFFLFRFEKEEEQSDESCRDLVSFLQFSNRLRLAVAFHIKASQTIDWFWLLLANMADVSVDDLAYLFDSINSAEHEAVAYYIKLLQKSPDRPQLLRALAGFMGSVRNRPEVVQDLLDRADELESGGNNAGNGNGRERAATTSAWNVKTATTSARLLPKVDHQVDTIMKVNEGGGELGVNRQVLFAEHERVTNRLGGWRSSFGRSHFDSIRAIVYMCVIVIAAFVAWRLYGEEVVVADLEQGIDIVENAFLASVSMAHVAVEVQSLALHGSVLATRDEFVASGRSESEFEGLVHIDVEDLYESLDTLAVNVPGFVPNLVEQLRARETETDHLEKLKLLLGSEATAVVVERRGFVGLNFLALLEHAAAISSTLANYDDQRLQTLLEDPLWIFVRDNALLMEELSSVVVLTAEEDFADIVVAAEEVLHAGFVTGVIVVCVTVLFVMLPLVDYIIRVQSEVYVLFLDLPPLVCLFVAMTRVGGLEGEAEAETETEKDHGNNGGVSYRGDGDFNRSKAHIDSQGNINLAEAGEFKVRLQVGGSGMNIGSSASNSSIPLYDSDDASNEGEVAFPVVASALVPADSYDDDDDGGGGGNGNGTHGRTKGRAQLNAIQQDAGTSQRLREAAASRENLYTKVLEIVNHPLIVTEGDMRLSTSERREMETLRRIESDRSTLASASLLSRFGHHLYVGAFRLRQLLKWLRELFFVVLRRISRRRTYEMSDMGEAEMRRRVAQGIARHQRQFSAVADDSTMGLRQEITGVLNKSSGNTATDQPLPVPRRRSRRMSVSAVLGSTMPGLPQITPSGDDFMISTGSQRNFAGRHYYEPEARVVLRDGEYVVGTRRWWASRTSKFETPARKAFWLRVLVCAALFVLVSGLAERVSRDILFESEVIADQLVQLAEYGLQQPWLLFFIREAYINDEPELRENFRAISCEFRQLMEHELEIFVTAQTDTDREHVISEDGISLRRSSLRIPALRDTLFRPCHDLNELSPPFLANAFRPSGSLAQPVTLDMPLPPRHLLEGIDTSLGQVVVNATCFEYVPYFDLVSESPIITYCPPLDCYAAELVRGGLSVVHGSVLASSRHLVDSAFFALADDELGVVHDSAGQPISFVNQTQTRGRASRLAFLDSSSHFLRMYELLRSSGPMARMTWTMLKFTVDSLREQVARVQSTILGGRLGSVVGIFIAVVIFVFPIIRRMQFSAYRTRVLLEMLPEEVLTNTPSIARFIQHDGTTFDGNRDLLVDAIHGALKKI